MKKRFVVFYSPGTFFTEDTTREIDTWDVKTAIEMARAVNERYGARPFGFRFILRERKEDELDSRVTEQSPMYYLGGRLLSLQDIIDRNDPKDAILISNMRSNDYKQVVENTNSWKTTQPFYDTDILLDVAL